MGLRGGIIQGAISYPANVTLETDWTIGSLPTDWVPFGNDVFNSPVYTGSGSYWDSSSDPSYGGSWTFDESTSGTSCQEFTMIAALDVTALTGVLYGATTVSTAGDVATMGFDSFVSGVEFTSYDQDITIPWNVAGEIYIAMTYAIDGTMSCYLFDDSGLTTDSGVGDTPVSDTLNYFDTRNYTDTSSGFIKTTHTYFTTNTVLDETAITAIVTGWGWAPTPYNPLDDAVLYYDSRDWPGGATSIPNQGSAGASYDLPVTLNVSTYGALLDTLGSNTITWADFGGLPSTAPFSMIFVCGDNISDPNALPVNEIGFYSTNTVYVDTWMSYIGTDTYQSVYIDGVVDPSPINATATNNSCWIVQIDLNAATVEVYRNNVLVASGSGPSVASAADTDLTTNADGIYLQLGHTLSSTTAGQTWDGTAGIGMTRTLLTSDQRVAWASTFS